MKLLVGLGNPGDKYAHTRHNIGFMAVERFADRHGLKLKKKGHQALFGSGNAGGVSLTVLLPQTFMNLSGVSVKSAVSSLDVASGDLIVVHDELDLPFGSLKLKEGGGHAGPNGLRNINQTLGDGNYIRLRLGIGRPPGGGDVTPHVLGGFNATERKDLDAFLDLAADALEAILHDGLARAMNQYNNRDISNTP